MLFTDVRFALLVLGCWITFRTLPAAYRSFVLATWGVIFYVLYAPAAAPFVFGLIVAVYVMPTSRWLLATVLAVAMLAYYKIVTGSPTLALASANPAAASPILMPLGLSFLAFELIHFSVERARGKIANASLLDYLAFALYFPCRVAGPIRRYPDFQRSVAEARPTVHDVYAGLMRVLIGIAKKVVFADLLALTVAELAYAETPLHLVRVVLAYAFQLYLDFSAYSDIAIGVSRMFGIVVPENFNHPYASQNIQEFWTRWHISLSTWVRDYIFLPVGRQLFATRLRPHAMLIAVVSYLVAFLAVGAWHGATPNFIVWGGYHGALLGAHHAYRKTVAVRFAAHPFYNSRAAAIVSVGVTFVAVAAGWILFLTPTLGEAARLVQLMVGLR